MRSKQRRVRVTIALVAISKSKRANPAFRNQDQARKEKTPPNDFASAPDPADNWPRDLGLGRWSIPQIMEIRDLQSRGQFRTPAKLARSFKTDGACNAALLNRIAPHRGLPREIVKCDPGGHAARDGGLVDQVSDIATELYGDSGTMLSPSFLKDANEYLAMFGFAVFQNVPVPHFDPDTGLQDRIDLRPEVFPMEYLEWFESESTLYALTTEGRIPVIHGDGLWGVIGADELEPWTWGALMALALIYADRTIGVRTRAANAQSAGDSKWIGELPPGQPVKGVVGQSLKTQMTTLYQNQRVVLIPNGSKVTRSESVFRAFEIFKAIIDSNNVDAFLVLIGQRGPTDSSQRLSAQQLFGVRNDIVEADLKGMARGVNQATVRVWQLLNYKRADLIEGIRWLIPDADEDARREMIGKRWDAFNKHVTDLRSNYFVIDQALTDGLAKTYGLPSPVIDKRISRAAIDETDIKYGGITPNEIRLAIMGELTELPPIDGGDETVPQVAKEAAFATDPSLPAGSPDVVGGGAPAPGAPPTPNPDNPQTLPSQPSPPPASDS